MEAIQTTATTIEFIVDEAADLLLAQERQGHRARGKAQANEVFRLSLHTMRCCEPLEAQRTLGRLVLSFLKARNPQGLGLAYEALEDADPQGQDTAQVRCEENTPAAVYRLAMSLIGQGMSTQCWSDVEQGEAFLDEAVRAGHPAAIRYQANVWVLMRPRLERRLKGT